MLHCLIQAEQSLHTISGNIDGHNNTAEKQLGMFRSQLNFADIEDIFDSGLHEYLDNAQKKLNLVSNAIFDTFFSIEKNKKTII
jgi:uncharacterized alpha-E superfamily protein